MLSQLKEIFIVWSENEIFFFYILILFQGNILGDRKGNNTNKESNTKRKQNNQIKYIRSKILRGGSSFYLHGMGLLQWNVPLDGKSYEA